MSMGDLVARTGRQQQRYEGGYRLVAGCIPYKFMGSDDSCNGNTKKTLKVLMITSQSGPGLLFPKGGWENDETDEEAACREAFEEAGVRGEIKGKLGSWDFKSKSHRDGFSPEGLCRAVMFAMYVTKELDSWPEQHSRERYWCEITEAGERCRYPWMKQALDECRFRYATVPVNTDSTVSPNGSSKIADEDS